MEFNKILIRYGELGLKSPPVRRRFLDRLITNIHKGLDTEKIEHKINKTRGRIFVGTPEIEEACSVLERVFGIVSFSPVMEIESNLNRICEKVTEFSKEYLEKDDKFAIRARRAGSHNFTSKMIERKAGKKVLETNEGVEVDLDNPNKIIYAEARQTGSYIFKEKIKGPGGLPLGTQGKVIVVFDEIFNSAVACWFLMKRGCSVVPVYVDNKPYLNLDKEIIKVKNKLKNWSIGEKFILKNFENGNNIFRIKEETDRGLGKVLNKRIIYKVMEKLAEKIDAKAVVSGENLESKRNFKTFKFSSIIKLPIFRPLIGFDKVEIEEYLRKLGLIETYKKSPKKKIFPKRVEPKEKEIRKAEEKLKIKEIVEKGLENLSEIK